MSKMMASAIFIFGLLCLCSQSAWAQQEVPKKDVDGKVIIGFIGGESIGATRGLAKEVAKVTKKEFF